MTKPRLLILGAHPDDAEFHAGGLITLYRRRGYTVKIVSVTNGGAGHHRRPPAELIALRRAEAAAVARKIGADYEVWDFADGELQATLDVRRRIIREIRNFAPDLVLTHRTCDYHPDHRAVGLAVQDASYMVTVPHIVPDAPPLRRDPVVAYMNDLFSRPCPMSADVALDITGLVDEVVALLACHRSQVFEWLPYNQGVEDRLPADDAGRRDWLRGWYMQRACAVADRFRPALIARYGTARGSAVRCAEVYEVSEYAAALDEQQRDQLFPREAGPDAA
jgi:LmbE family N-acetylglucosaminyl deacetylase